MKKRIKEAIQRGFVRAFLCLPDKLLIKLSGRKQIIIKGRTLCPKLQVAMVPFNQGQKINEMELSKARHVLGYSNDLFTGKSPELKNIENRQVNGPGGKIPIRIYTPIDIPDPGPVIVFFHGGGWILCSIESHDLTCRILAHESKCIVVSVDYRLAPEYKFPSGLEDAYTAYKYAVENADSFKGNPEKVAVSGDSAGGNLAASLCHIAKEKGEKAPLCQLLFYPATDLRQGTESYKLFADDFFLTKDIMTWFINNYLPDSTYKSNPKVSIILAENLHGLPHAIIATAGFDPLHDEGELYAKNLEKAGVKVTYRSFPSLVHGFISYCGIIPEARKAFLEITAIFKQTMYN